MNIITQEDLEQRAKLILGISENENPRKAYLEKAKEFHPDMPNGNILFMQLLNEAYNILRGNIPRYPLIKDETLFFQLTNSLPPQTEYQKHIEQFYGVGVI